MVTDGFSVLSVPLSPANYYKEYKTIKVIALNSGYNPSIIDNFIKKKNKIIIIYLFTSIPKADTVYRKIAYFGKPSAKIRNGFLCKNTNHKKPNFKCKYLLK